MSYEVRTGDFQGPLDLLLHLILRDELDLYAISLTELVDVYLQEIEHLLAESAGDEDDGRDPRIDLETATEFLLIAATLVELKTRRLLPGTDDGDLDAELAIWEERDLLLARLLECKTFKNAAQAFRSLVETADRVVARTAGPDERFIDLQPDILAGVTPDQLARACAHALTPRPRERVSLDHIAPIRASVTDAVATLLLELPRARQLSFRAITAHLVDRIEVVVRFLAVLELFKQGFVDLTQTGTFGDIGIHWIGDPSSDDYRAAVAATDARYSTPVDAYDG